ncbi:MAG: hypothetical protein HN348_32810, partial [Proteobacteria bacterium]|nr:hypothetical protein [Pseudomonadota bacterium]
MPQIKIILNGRPLTVTLDEPLSTLEVLREKLGITSLKCGCAPQAICGCCTILINGKATKACTRPFAKLNNATIVTLEGLDAHQRQVLSRAFVTKGGLQCGFCTPGIAMRAVELLDKTPHPTDEQIKKALATHLCRCTGYTKIIASIREASRHWNSRLTPGPAGSVGRDSSTGNLCFESASVALRPRNQDSLPSLTDDSTVGARASRYRGQDQVLGQKPFVDDLKVPEMVHGALRLTDHARAKVISIDTAPALAIEGV